METVKLVKLYPAEVWIESGMMGDRAVVIQHEGCEPFEYAVFNYDYRYTSNSGTWNSARKLALSLGASDPVKEVPRKEFKQSPDEIRDLIAMLNEQLICLESDEK